MILCHIYQSVELLVLQFPYLSYNGCETLNAGADSLIQAASFGVSKICINYCKQRVTAVVDIVNENDQV